MATFSSTEQFKDLKQYILILKKALLVVKPETQKKFLYYKSYAFGPKKLPLVLVDYDAGCQAELAKAGVKPTAEGMVALTAANELDFQAKKGALKRSGLKKHFATLGAGFKPIYVPVGEVEEDEDEDEGEAKAEEGKGTGNKVDENAAKRAEVLTRIGTLQAKTFPAKTEALKKPVLEKAKSLAETNRFAEAKVLLDQLEAKAASPDPSAAAAGTAPAAAKDGAGDGDFQKEWKAARQDWQTASAAVGAQLAQLQKAMKQSGDKELEGIEVESVTDSFKEPLLAGLGQVDKADGAALKRAAAKARIIIGGFRKHIENDVTVQACDKNPFKAPVTIRQTLGSALEKLDKALASAAE